MINAGGLLVFQKVQQRVLTEEKTSKVYDTMTEIKKGNRSIEGVSKQVMIPYQCDQMW